METNSWQARWHHRAEGIKITSALLNQLWGEGGRRGRWYCREFWDAGGGGERESEEGGVIGWDEPPAGTRPPLMGWGLWFNLPKHWCRGGNGEDLPLPPSWCLFPPPSSPHSLQWLENCRKTFGDKDGSQQPDTQAQVRPSSPTLCSCSVASERRQRRTANQTAPLETLFKAVTRETPLAPCRLVSG